MAIFPALMSILLNILLTLYVFVALLMTLVILMQRPKSEGLGAAFGGGVTENIFGAQTTNVLTKITGWLAGIFFLLTFVLSILYAHKGNTESGLRRELMKGQTPAPSASPSTSAVPAGQASPSEGSPAELKPGQDAPSGSPVAPVTAPAQQEALPPADASPKPADLAVGAVAATSPERAPSAPPSASPKKKRKR